MSNVKTITLSRRFACALHSVIIEGSTNLTHDFTFTNGWEGPEIQKLNQDVLIPLCDALVRGEPVNLEINGSDNRDSYGAPYETEH